MSFDLSQLKELRERGAGVQMQDDVANYVGGFESPLFFPTVEFILTMKDAVKEVSVDKSQGIDLSGFGLPEVYDPSYFEKISMRASKEAVNNSADMSVEKQRLLLDYLDNMEIQRADLLGVLGLDPGIVGTDAIYNPSGTKPKRTPREGSRLLSLFHTVIENMRNLKLRVIMSNQTQQAQRLTIAQRVRDLVSRTVFREARMKMQYRDKIGDLEGREGGHLEMLNDGTGSKKSGEGDKQGSYDLDRREDKGEETIRGDKVSIHDVAGKYEQAESRYSESKRAIEKENKKAEEEVSISQGIDKTIKEAKVQKIANDAGKADGRDEDKEKNLQREVRIRQMRLRVQQLRQTTTTRNAVKNNHLHNDHGDEMHIKTQKKKQSEENVKNMTGTDAVKNLQGFGVSMNDTVTATSLKNSEVEQTKKTELQK